MANLFGTSVDYLIKGHGKKIARASLKNTGLLKQFEQAEGPPLPHDSRTCLFFVDLKRAMAAHLLKLNSILICLYCAAQREPQENA
jgi:hypothetical protein